MAQFTFNSRETYIAYRADWRAKYRALTLEIRANKAAQRASKSNDEVAGLQSELHYLRRQANVLMKERTEATKFKNEQLAQAVAEAA